LAATVFVLAGWPVERKVRELRVPRNQTTEDFLRTKFALKLSRVGEDAQRRFLEQELETSKTAMQAAHRDFANWHFVSLILNFATIVCVTGAMAMAGNLEDSAVKESKEGDGEKPKGDILGGA
jgi:hypothetical protein